MQDAHARTYRGTAPDDSWWVPAVHTARRQRHRPSGRGATRSRIGAHRDGLTPRDRPRRTDYYDLDRSYSAQAPNAVPIRAPYAASM